MMASGTTCVLLVIAVVTVAESRPYSFIDLFFPSQYYTGAQPTRRPSPADEGYRGPRQTSYYGGTSAAQLIDSIFQVPIQTLSSVGQLVKTTADLPGAQRRRQQRQQALDAAASRASRRSPRNRQYLSEAAQTADLPVAEDGSSYKI